MNIFQKIKIEVVPFLTIEHDKIQVEKFLNHLCEDLSCVSDIHRLRKWKPGKNDQRPRPLLLSLTNPWTVRKLLSRAHTMNEYNRDCKIYVGKSLTKDEQELERKCLSMRWKLINEKKFSGDSLKIRS